MSCKRSTTTHLNIVPWQRNCTTTRRQSSIFAKMSVLNPLQHNSMAPWCHKMVVKQNFCLGEAPQHTSTKKLGIKLTQNGGKASAHFNIISWHQDAKDHGKAIILSSKWSSSTHSNRLVPMQASHLSPRAISASVSAFWEWQWLQTQLTWST